MTYPVREADCMHSLMKVTEDGSLHCSMCGMTTTRFTAGSEAIEEMRRILHPEARSE